MRCALVRLSTEQPEVHSRLVPHRDQAEAMRLRIEALERKLKDAEREGDEARARLEEQLAQARGEHSRGERSGDGRSGGDRSRSEEPAGSAADESKTKHRRRFWFAVLLVVGLAALWAGWFVLVSVAFPSSAIRDLRVVTSDDGESALFVSEVVRHMGEDDDYYTSRLAVYDLATGERRSRRVVQWTREDGLTVLGPGPQGVWAYEYGEGVVLLDRSDGSVLRTPEDLLGDAHRRLLWSGELDRRVGYLAADEAVVVTLRDGTRLVVDGHDAPRPYQGELPRIPGTPSPSAPTVRRLDDGAVLRLEPREGDVQRARRLRPSGPVLLDAFFVEGATEQPILVDATSVLVVHAESLEENAEHLMSRVSLDRGERVWTARLGSVARVMLAHASDDAVMLVVDDTLLAFGLARGEERYRVDL